MFKKWQQLANVDALNRSRWLLYENSTIDWELLYINNLERTLSTLCRLGQITQIWTDCWWHTNWRQRKLEESCCGWMQVELDLPLRFYGILCWWPTSLAWEVLVGQIQCWGLERWGNWNVGDFQLLAGCIQGYHWLEGFWQWSIWIEFHMIEDVLEIWRRQLLSHCRKQSTGWG